MDWKCRQGDRCVCGGDVPAVRATCQQYIKTPEELVIPYPDMPNNEYEWLHCTVMPAKDGHSETMTVYRHRMSNRVVIVCKRGNDLTTIWLPQEVVTIIKARF